jgi:DNA polymerase III subunit epsilon
MLVAGVDVETTGTDKALSRITEIGAALFEATEDGIYTPVGTPYSTLVWDESYPKQSEEVLRVTGITDEQLRAEGKSPKEAIAGALTAIGQAQYVIAYNKQFDEVLIAAECVRIGLPTIPAANWLCAYQDVKYEEHFKCRKLSHLALDHGIIVEPDTLHRAIGDVQLMFQLLTKRRCTIAQMLAMSQEPWAIITAQVSFNDKEKAKARRYSWEKVDDKTYPKKWVKKIKLGELAKEQAEAGFPVVRIG